MIAAFAFLLSCSAFSKPKYELEVTLLSRSHEYIQKNAAPDYWVLSPYYIGQQTESACSLAVLATIVNAARSSTELKADDELVSQSALLKKLADSTYEKEVAAGGNGVNLDRFKDVVERGLRAYSVNDFTLIAVHTPDEGKAVQERFHRDLIENEGSGRDFIVSNFIQGILTGDEPVGHFAALGAYDAKNRRVLIFDPDRQWYEPYWVSESTLLKAMVAKDKDAPRGRGYLWLKLKK